MKIYLIAGEPSGDLLGSALMRALRAASPDVEFRGVGGETMAAEGLESRFDIADIAVMGVTEVLMRLRLVLRRVRETADDILRWQPDVVVTIDSWGFASALISKLRKKRTAIPIVHYVAPQVWAWKRGRAKNVARLVDRLMMLLPYEGKYFEKYGLQCDFVGHPLVERMQDVHTDPVAFRRRHAIPPEAMLLCVLPGSRRGEVRRLAPILFDAAALIRRQFPDIHLIVPTVAGVAQEVRRTFARSSIPATVVVGEQARYEAFAASRLALAKSGTVSLELVALGTPHLIAYTFDKLTNWLILKAVHTRFANRINILVQREVIPEFVLSRCRSELIAQSALDLLENEKATRKQVAESQKVMQQLRLPDMMPSQRAAQIVLEEAR